MLFLQKTGWSNDRFTFNRPDCQSGLPYRQFPDFNIEFTLGRFKGKEKYLKYSPLPLYGFNHLHMVNTILIVNSA